jgi:hypothetical protein
VPYDLQARIVSDDAKHVQDYEHPHPPAAVIAVDGVLAGHRAIIEGRVIQVDDILKDDNSIRTVVAGDDSGEIKVTFGPGHGGDDIEPGQILRVMGKAHQTGSRPTSIANPSYTVVVDAANEALGEVPCRLKRASSRPN